MRNHVALLLCVLSLSLMLTGCNSAQSDVQSTSKLEASYWEATYGADEFGDETDNSFVSGLFSGKFTNSATLGSDLTVFVTYLPDSDPDSEIFTFHLLEYGNSLANLWEDDVANLSIKINGEIYRTELDNWDGVLCLYSKYYDLGHEQLRTKNNADEPAFFNHLLAALRSGDTVSCHIAIGDIDDVMDSSNSCSQYNFKINGSGFAEQEKVVRGG